LAATNQRRGGPDEMVKSCVTEAMTVETNQKEN
jgi:hypothetical protein